MDELDALSAEADRLAALRADGRTPAVVRRACLRRGLTLRRWLALEEADSPLISGRWPTGDAEAMAKAFCTAWETVFPGRCIPPAEDLGAAMAELNAEVERAFSTVMPMRWPRVAGAAEKADAPDGLGWVVRLLARFPYPPDVTLDMPMDLLFALAAGSSANEGAECAGQDYRERLPAAATGKVILEKAPNNEDYRCGDSSKNNK